MPDGIKIAVDVYLPKKIVEKYPALVYFTRYTRAFDLKAPFNKIFKHFFGQITKKEITYFTSHGYACVLVDLRGSGSSTGKRLMEFGHEEIDDMHKVIDWIISEPWSDGKIATTGVSYAATTAEFSLSTKHPAIKACVPRSGLFDLYTDVNFPGGIRQTHFIDIWQKGIKGLDTWDYTVFGKLAPYVLKSSRKIAEDVDSIILKQAKKDHEENFDVFAGIKKIKARNDVVKELGYCNDDFSVHTRLRSIQGSNVPIYRISGWYDGAFVNSAIKGFLNTPENSNLLIGPWDHGPRENISPFKKSNKLDYNIFEEIKGFLDCHVKGIKNHFQTKAKVNYFLMGKEKFISAETWPDPRAKEQCFFLQNKALTEQTPESNGEIEYTCDYSISSGKSIRWNSQTPSFRKGEIRYGNRKKVNQKMLVFTSEPMHQNLDISGHGIIELFMSFDTTDAHVFVYLEDVSKDGNTSTYITEAMLAARHQKIQPQENNTYTFPVPYRSFKIEDMENIVPHQITKLKFDFFPIGYTLKKDHKLQISIAAADFDHFDHPEDMPEKMKVYFGPKYPSKLLIPIIM